MPTPDNLEPRINRARSNKPPIIARAIAQRAIAEEEYVRTGMQKRAGEKITTHAGTPFADEMLKVLARTATVFLPQANQEHQLPDSALDHRTFTRTALRLLPDSKPKQKIQENPFDNPMAALEETVHRENQSSVNSFLRLHFGANSFFPPPVGSVPELIRMHETATFLGENIPKPTYAAEEPEKSTARVYTSPSLYDVLQKEHYGGPMELMDRGLDIIGQITGRTLAEFELFSESGKLPEVNADIPVYSHHEVRAADQRAKRTKLLADRVNHLWPDEKA